MMIDKIKRKLRKGAGEAISFTFAVGFLIFFFLTVVSLYNYMRATESMNYALQEISRGVAACTSMSEARDAADGYATLFFNDTIVMPKNKIKTQISYANGASEYWGKGNYITVYLSADIRNILPIASGVTEISQVVMIENDGDESAFSSAYADESNYYWEDFDGDGGDAEAIAQAEAEEAAAAAEQDSSSKKKSSSSSSSGAVG